MPETAAQVCLPRELVLASAGTGKTFRLSSRIVGLLNAGARPEEILASTFTRKAAGEILERVLVRLALGALDDAEARELQVHAGLEGAPPIDRARAGELLGVLVSNLSRVGVSTLDGFFHRIARAFTLELGIEPGWEVADQAEGDALVLAAVDRLLDRVGEGELVELLRLYRSGEAQRGVHGEIETIVTGLQAIHRDLDPAARDPWAFPGGDGERPTDDELEAAAAVLDSLELPLTGSGRPRHHWANACRKHAEALRRGDWDGLFGSGVLARLLAGETHFDRTEIPGAFHELHRSCVALARRALGAELQARARALERLAGSFEEAFRRTQETRALYRFEDIPHLLSRAGATGRGDELFYRLDGRIRHLLLDEFQDTSVLQWRTLAPLADEILQTVDGDRATVIVADPKQSIYAWRGAEPRLIDAVQERSGIERDELGLSWRTAQPVLDAVNRIFGRVADSEALQDPEPEVAREWVQAFPEHRAARPELAGFVRVVRTPSEEHRRHLRDGVLDGAKREVLGLRESAPGATVGVLCRTTKAAVRMTFALRNAGVEVSEEGGGPITDAWAVHPVLAALRLADHPGDLLARYLVAHSPLGAALGLEDPGDEGAAGRLSSAVRRSLLQDGYGPVLEGWARCFDGRAGRRDRARLAQLVELGFRRDGRGPPLRPTEFVRAVESTRVEAPGEARVRVMTIHAAKGLEFDAVVLPELECPFGGRRDNRPVAVRDRADGPVVQVLPFVHAALLPLFPEVEAACRAEAAAGFRDELSVLYVALTRARHALHLVVEEGREEARTPARLIREGLGLGADPIRVDGADAVLFEEGDAAWARRAGKADGPGREAARPPPSRPLRFRPGPRRRVLPSVTPSELEGEGTRTLADLLRVGGEGARARGTVAHAWLEMVEWIEDGVPTDEALLARAAARAPGWADARGVLPEFRRWLEGEALAAVLRRSAHPAGTRVERELPFLHRDGDRVLAGTIDRLHVAPGEGGEGGEGPRIAVVDFKTDAVPDETALAARVEHYRPQVAAYRRAMAARFRVPEGNVEGLLVFLGADRLVRL